VFQSLSPARRRLVLTLGSIVAIAALVGAVFGGLGAVGHSAAEPANQAEPGPVLLVPGYGGSTTGLQTLARLLRAEGRDTTVLTLPDGGQGDLNVQARTLQHQVAAVRSRTGAASVDVVGYSAGGVVARLWAKDFGGADIARRIVTLGSPQHGTQLASLGSLVPGACPTACQQLEPSSVLLASLNQGAEVPAGPKFVSIWTSHDNVVIPPESAELAGALNLRLQDVCPNSTVDHSGLPSDPLVDHVVLTQLGSGPPQPASALDCARLSS
jgi:triacylglycerol esterase/lipase EstA (alpha/beta hydrolase family)